MAGQLLYTIGYEGSSVEAFAQTLQEAGVSRVIDIRCVPLSRKRGFSKQALAHEMDCRGIEYVHIGALGNPKPGREAARLGDFRQFNQMYRTHLASREAQAALKHATSLALETTSCLLCFESDHKNCHRALVAEAMTHQERFEIAHLRVHSHDKRDHSHDTGFTRSA